MPTSLGRVQNGGARVGRAQEGGVGLAVGRAGGATEGRGISGSGAIAPREIAPGGGDALREEEPNDHGVARGGDSQEGGTRRLARASSPTPRHRECGRDAGRADVQRPERGTVPWNEPMHGTTRGTRRGTAAVMRHESMLDDPPGRPHRAGRTCHGTAGAWNRKGHGAMAGAREEPRDGGWIDEPYRKSGTVP